LVKDTGVQIGKGSMESAYKCSALGVHEAVYTDDKHRQCFVNGGGSERFEALCLFLTWKLKEKSGLGFTFMLVHTSSNVPSTEVTPK